jgi:radical SAM protein with 4Fe4S-binding SPASM domain
MVVWELTLSCDLACGHCGSRAGKARDRELTTDEAVDLVDQLADLGTRELALIGGEAYLHPGWLDVIRRARARGIRPTMVTGGRGLDRDRARAAADAGMEAISVSIDGTRASHDRLRRLTGSFDAATAAVRRIRDAGMEPYANSQLSRINLGDVERLADLLLDLGVRAWQVGLVVPLGRGAEMADELLQPFDLLGLMPRIAAAARRLAASGCRTVPANNLGYYGPHAWELRTGFAPWAGCAAGVNALGIESDGGIKGCPSLPTAGYVGGSVRDRSLAELWAETRELAFARRDRTEELWGFCADCSYAAACAGGCSFTAHALFGRRGNNPYCHHRAVELARAGVAERLRQVEPAPGLPFDHGRFELVREPLTADHRTEARRRRSLPVVQRERR